MRRSLRLRSPFVLALAVLATSAAHAESASKPTLEVDPITKVGDPLAETEVWRASGDELVLPAPDTADVLRAAPGAEVNSNGPLTGQVQYRGMYGPRMNVLVDGAAINPGGPNWMDPPLHYIARPVLDTIELERGISSVRSGIESFGGTVRATSKQSRFGTSERFEPQVDLESSYQSVDGGYSAGGMIGAANDTHRFHLVGSRQDGGHRRFGSGSVRPTTYERNQFGGGYGLRLGAHEFEIDYGRNDTHAAGTPALPMDIRYVDTHRGRFGYRGEIGRVAVRSLVYVSDVEHKMDNYTQRSAPASPAGFRFTRAKSDGAGFALSGEAAMLGGDVAVGVDGHFADHDATIYNPNAQAFFVENFKDVERDRLGFFGEWRGEVVPRLSAEAGVRYTRVEMDAGRVDALPARLMLAPRLLRDAFNAAGRSQDDDNVDAVLKLRYELRDELQLVLGAARKTRSPSYIERYLWLPLQSTGGLADGNTYVGDPSLDPERSLDAEIGMDWRSERVYFSPRAFYRHVDDYIQGVATTSAPVVMVSTANGDPTPLQFANVDARFYGVDVNGGVKLFDHWHVDGVLSWVRGKRRDIADDLYRIAPLHGRLSISYRRASYHVGAEGVFAHRQDDVSRTNGETDTAGHALLDLFGRYTFERTKTQIDLGLTNVLDKDYDEHLAGTQRARNGDVPAGDRLPGDGRSVYVRIVQRW
ncbi:MAG: TonB-dependent receptor [Myxococcales bacterium]|nr:TonB-dependent receptor [Myxococcales bacterium]